MEIIQLWGWTAGLVSLDKRSWDGQNGPDEPRGVNDDETLEILPQSAGTHLQWIPPHDSAQLAYVLPFLPEPVWRHSCCVILTSCQSSGSTSSATRCPASSCGELPRLGRRSCSLLPPAAPGCSPRSWGQGEGTQSSNAAPLLGLRLSFLRLSPLFDSGVPEGKTSTIFLNRWQLFRSINRARCRLEKSRWVLTGRGFPWCRRSPRSCCRGGGRRRTRWWRSDPRHNNLEDRAMADHSFSSLCRLLPSAYTILVNSWCGKGGTFSKQLLHSGFGICFQDFTHFWFHSIEISTYGQWSANKKQSFFSPDCELIVKQVIMFN